MVLQGWKFSFLEGGGRRLSAEMSSKDYNHGTGALFLISLFLLVILLMDKVPKFIIPKV
jgi:hypothetical protein